MEWTGQDMALPFVMVQLADGADDIAMPVMAPMAHIQPRNIHAIRRKGLQHFRRAGGRSNGANDFGSPCAPEACGGAIYYSLVLLKCLLSHEPAKRMLKALCVPYCAAGTHPYTEQGWLTFVLKHRQC